MIETENTGLPGVIVITPKRYRDPRGWFTETWNRQDMSTAGLDVDFVQDNHSFSASKGTLRGLHLQRPPHAQQKLVRCSRGAILDVAVDARAGSPTYGRWIAAELSEGNGRQLFLPEGFLHGFLTLTDACEVAYKCSDYYAPDCEETVRWNSLGIDWPLTGDKVLSDKDAAAPSFTDWNSPFLWEGVV